MKLTIQFAAFSLATAMMGLTATAQTSASAPQSPALFKQREGPLYSPTQLRERQVIGLRLGMGFTEAHDLAVANGFTPQSKKAVRDRQRRLDMHFIKPAPDGRSELLVLSYEPDGPRQISSIRYMRPLTETEERQVGMQREAILKAHGAPSEWTQRIDADGAIRDEFAYVVSPSLRDGDARQTLSSCHTDWRYQYECRQFDCRHAMEDAREPVLTIAFGHQAVHYSWDDYEVRYPTSVRGLAARLIRPKTEQCLRPSVN